MKKLIPLLILITVGCGSNSQSPSAPKSDWSGHWSVTVSEAGFPDVPLQLTLVKHACTVTEQGITFTVQGTQCLLADNPGGIGNASCGGSCNLTPQGALLGISGTSSDFLYVATDAFGDMFVYEGTASFTTGQMAGNWVCYPGIAGCSGEIGTFTGYKTTF